MSVRLEMYMRFGQIGRNSNKLDVPRIRIYNNCMMNESEKRNWIQEGISEFYWKYRDDLTDEGGEQLMKELDKLQIRMQKITQNEMSA